MKTIQHLLTLDLQNDKALIAEYEAYHKAGNVWPEVVRSICDAGIIDMQIHRLDTRLVMLLTVTPEFSFEAKARADANNEVVQQWETLMEKFQRVDPENNKTKWQLMHPIFALADNL